MRIHLLAGALLVCGVPVVTAAAGEAPRSHQITCASPRAVRDYEDGLAALHANRPDQAVRDFQDAVRREGTCAMAHWGLSRALGRNGRAAEAAAEAARAEELAVGADDREERLIRAWAKYLKAPAQPGAERDRALNGARRDLDLALALYPDDPEVWLLRGELAESPLRAAPFYLAALRLAPGHPFGRAWSPQVPPLPQLTPTETQPVAAIEKPQLFEGLGRLSYSITTPVPEAQLYFEQGLRLFHSYVTPPSVRNSASRCFQYAANLDPGCAMAYWGLSFCQAPPAPAANRALELALKNGTDRERRMCAARVLELGGQARREEFLDALDGALLAYSDDVELWTWRGKVWSRYGEGPPDGRGIPYQLAALRIRPEHPSPNHELVHAYEGIDRPALGWPYTEAYRKSAPNMPHANHMQAHLAMRLGRWQDAIDATRTSRQRSLAGLPELAPAHHIDVMVRALAHEGRFKEAEAESQAYRNGLPWARLLRLKGIPAELEEWAERRQGGNNPEGVYIAALVKLDRGDLQAAAPLVDKIEEQFKKQPANIYRFQETKGRYLVQSGKVEEGLKLLREAADRAAKDSGLHAWGEGGYQMEVWGETALRAQRWSDAQLAFLEALAHERGNVIAALGLQVAAEATAQPEIAAHYAARAKAIWKDADAGALERQLERLRKLASGPAGAVR